jgi:hypothetical protein
MLAPRRHPNFSAKARLPGAGMPQERLARIAARMMFVDLKQRFATALAGVPGRRGRWLRDQVIESDDPIDLWLLRGAVFSALREQGTDASRQARFNLYDAVARVFPDNEELMPVL